MTRKSAKRFIVVRSNTPPTVNPTFYTRKKAEERATMLNAMSVRYAQKTGKTAYTFTVEERS